MLKHRAKKIRKTVEEKLEKWVQANEKLTKEKQERELIKMFKNISTQDSQPRRAKQFIEPRHQNQGFAAQPQESLNTSQTDGHKKFIRPDLMERIRSCL